MNADEVVALLGDPIGLLDGLGLAVGSHLILDLLDLCGFNNISIHKYFHLIILTPF